MRVENQRLRAGSLQQFGFPSPAAALGIALEPAMPWSSWTCFDHACLLNASPCEAHFSIFNELMACVRFQQHRCKLFLTNLAESPWRLHLLRWRWGYVSCYSPELWQAARLHYRWYSLDWYTHWGGKRQSWISSRAYIRQRMKNKMNTKLTEKQLTSHLKSYPFGYGGRSAAVTPRRRSQESNTKMDSKYWWKRENSNETLQARRAFDLNLTCSYNFQRSKLKIVRQCWPRGAHAHQYFLNF